MSKRIQILERLPVFSPHAQRFRAEVAGRPDPVELRLLPEGAPPEIRAIFLDELEDLVNLDHPAFPRVLESGSTRERPFYAVEPRAYRNLWQVSRKDDPDLATRCEIARQLADALDAAHRRQIFLGPPSPLTSCWDAASRAASFVHHRYTPQVKTLPFNEFVPPEVLRPDAWTTASDVFHWAFFSYWLISGGALPYQSRGAAVPIRCVTPELSRDLAHALDASLSREAARRPAHGGELKALLESNPTDLTEEVNLLLSGTIPQEAVKGSLARLRETGRIQDPPEKVDRVSASLSPMSLDIPNPVADTPVTAAPGVAAPAARPEMKRAGSLAAGAVAVLVVGAGAYGFFSGGPGGGFPAGPSGPPPTRAAPPPPPPPPAPPPGGYAKYWDDNAVRRLILSAAVNPARFPSVHRRLGMLSKHERLPPEFADEDRIAAFKKKFATDPEGACRDVQRYLEELKALVAPKGGG